MDLNHGLGAVYGKAGMAYDFNEASPHQGGTEKLAPPRTLDAEQQFIDAMARRNLVPPKGGLIADGKIHRCDTTSRNGKGDGSYCLHLDDHLPPAGWFENHQDGGGVTKWSAIRSAPLSPSEERKLKALQRKQAKEREEQREREAIETAQTARKIWDACREAPADHPYLVKKSVPSYGLRMSGNALVAAVWQSHGVTSLQYIYEDSEKRFLPGGTVKGGMFPIGAVSGAAIVLICEGYATAATLHRATGYPCLVAFDAGNLMAVAKEVRARLPDITICICADDDWKTLKNDKPHNAGRLAANAAAKAVDGVVAWPIFPDERQDKWTDFNDLEAALGGDKGRAEVRRQVDMRLGKNVAETGSGLWQANLLLSLDGTPRDCMTNVVFALRGDAAFVDRLRFDEHRSMAICRDLPWDKGSNWREWTERDDLALMEFLQIRKIPINKSRVADGVAHVANEHRCHPIQEWLLSLEWDRNLRLDTWMIKYLGAKDTPYVRAVSAAWMISGIARAMKPGCKVDHMLVLEGLQGPGKSTALKALMFDESFFSDEISNLGSKDSAQDLRGKWLIEVSELSAINRSDNERTKAFITRSTDHYRPSYGRRSQDFPRQCFFAGTTNHETYLPDETGNRRYWPVAIAFLLLDELRQDRDQLWAEAMYRYQSGEKWWLAADMEKLAREEQAARGIVDPWQDAVLLWAEDNIKNQIAVDKRLAEAKAQSDADYEFRKRRIEEIEKERRDVAVTVPAALSHLSVSRDKHDQASANRVARILRKAGYQRYRQRYSDKLEWEYRKVLDDPS